MERDNFHAGILFIIKNCFYPQKHVFICSKIYPSKEKKEVFLKKTQKLHNIERALIFYF